MNKIVKNNNFSIISIGKRLQHLRSIAGLSRHNVEKRLGIPEPTLKNWEKNETKVSDVKINHYLDLLKIVGINASFQWVKYGTGPEPFSHNLMDQYSLAETSKEYEYERNLSKFYIANVNISEQIISCNSIHLKFFSSELKNTENTSLKYAIGDVNYKVISPYIKLVLSGLEVNFEMPWKINKEEYCFVKVKYLPDSNVGNIIIGFFSVMEEFNPFLDKDHNKKSDITRLPFNAILLTKVNTLVLNKINNYNNCIDYNTYVTLIDQAYRQAVRLGEIDHDFISYLFTIIQNKL